MPFKIKDLMIDVLPEAGGGGANVFCCPGTQFFTKPCCAWTNVMTVPCCPGTQFFTKPCCAWTNFVTVPCCPGTQFITFCCPGTMKVTCCPGTGLGTIPCGPITCPALTRIPVDQGGGVATPENLATLKAELQQALAQVEAQEQAMEVSQKPQTFEEAEELEQKLLEALEALRQHKEQMQREATGEEQ